MGDRGGGGGGGGRKRAPIYIWKYFPNTAFRSHRRFRFKVPASLKQTSQVQPRFGEDERPTQARWYLSVWSHLMHASETESLTHFVSHPVILQQTTSVSSIDPKIGLANCLHKHADTSCMSHSLRFRPNEEVRAPSRKRARLSSRSAGASAIIPVAIGSSGLSGSATGSKHYG
jgi:hypothetical protein